MGASGTCTAAPVNKRTSARLELLALYKAFIESSINPDVMKKNNTLIDYGNCARKYR